MIYRLAKPCDFKEIANIHLAIRDSNSLGIFSQLGKSFLRQYYKIILNDQNEIIICAKNEYGKILGFCSSTMDAKHQLSTIRKHKLSLGFAALRSIIFRPLLLKELISRYNSIRGNKGKNFIFTEGAREEYWAWSPIYKDSISSIEMHETLLKILRDLGVLHLNFEVDMINRKIFLFHMWNNAELIKIIVLPDGRERAFMRYHLLDRKSILR